MNASTAARLAELPRDRLLVEMSLWSADLTRLADAIARVDHLADAYHIDVADGHFSPQLLFFPDLVAAIRKLTRRPLHVHLMARDEILLEQIEQFSAAGADIVSVHAENAIVNDALSLIEALGCTSGLVLQLQTPVAVAAAYLDRVSVITLLGTRIGVKGQDLDSEALARLQEARALIRARAGTRHTILVADGAIRQHTVEGLRRAGADAVVAGSLVFNASDIDRQVRWLHTLQAEGAQR